MSNSARRMSTSFREADIEAVMGNIHSGRSTEVIGLGSVGKSNFLRRLLLTDVQERYLYQQYGEQAHCIFIPIDSNSLLEPLPNAVNQNESSGWTGYELIASRLLRAIMENGLVDHIKGANDPAHPENLFRLYHRIWPGDNPNQFAHVVAFRYLEDLVGRVFAAANRPMRFVFMFDEFEKMLAEMPPRFFRCMRSLRDQYKDRILFITAARQITPLLVPQEDYLEYEPFLELFNDSRHFLLPYRPFDVEQTFERLAARQDQAPPPAHLREQLLAVTGGHAGLIRSSFAAWAPERLLRDGLSDQEMVALLLNISSVSDECKTMWRSLSDAERGLLFLLAQRHQAGSAGDIRPASNSMARLLIRKGLILGDEYVGFEHIRPNIFAAFVYSLLPADAARQSNRETVVPNFPAGPQMDF